MITYDEMRAWLCTTYKAKRMSWGDTFAYEHELERMLKDPFDWVSVIRDEFRRVFGDKHMFVNHGTKEIYFA